MRSPLFGPIASPRYSATEKYDAKRKTYELTLEQVTAPTPGQPVKKPLQIPLGLGLVGPDGEDMPLDLEGVGTLNAPLIELNEPKKTFRFRNVASKPVLSLNRDFSAPYGVADHLRAVLPWLTQLLQQGDGAGWRLETPSAD